MTTLEQGSWGRTTALFAESNKKNRTENRAQVSGGSVIHSQSQKLNLQDSQSSFANVGLYTQRKMKGF